MFDFIQKTRNNILLHYSSSIEVSSDSQRQRIFADPSLFFPASHGRRVLAQFRHRKNILIVCASEGRWSVEGICMAVGVEDGCVDGSPVDLKANKMISFGLTGLRERRV